MNKIDVKYDDGDQNIWQGACRSDRLTPLAMRTGVLLQPTCHAGFDMRSP